MLGIELVRTEHELSTDEVPMLVACTVSAASSRLANEVIGELCGSPFGMQVEDLITLLDPCCQPHRVEQRLAFRALFRPDTGKLIKAGLIALDVKDEAPPAELLGAWVQVTAIGFKAVTGFPP